MSKYTYNGNEYIIHTNGYDASGYGSIYEIIQMNEYTLNNFVGLKNKVLIDIGANTGVATIILAKQNPDSIVYAFEPFDSCVDLIKKNIESNGLKNVVLIKKGVTNKSGIETIYINEGVSGANTLYCDESGFSKECKVQKMEIETIDFNEFIKSKNIKEIELLKIDCEGAEYDILYNNTLLKSGKIKNIVGEFHDFKKYKDNKDYLNYNGKDLYTYISPYINGLKKITFLDLTNRY